MNYVALTLIGAMLVASHAGAEYRDLYADTWVATDAVGRSLPDHEEVGPPREDRTVGIFYWTWLTSAAESNAPHVYDVTALIEENPEAPEWGPLGKWHHWGKPEMGYYVATDEYVLRKHANMLVQAGVDVLFFDTTNPPHTWKESYMALAKVFTEMMEEGNKVPQFAFLGPFGNPMPVLERIYDELYEPGLYEHLWFQWEGKPLVLANPDYVEDPGLLDFFTYRRPMPTYFDDPSGPNQWGWSHVYPQPVFYGATPDDIEQITVSVGQNAVDERLAPMSHKDGAYGRSWHEGRKDPDPDSILYGPNFQEQFDRALEVDPPFIFITGWNEWVALRFLEWAGYTAEEHCYYPDALFVDQYDHEYSRDIEPMHEGHTDNYYYQLVANVRRYKGVREPEPASAPKSITINGGFDEWDDVGPEFRDPIGDTAHRDHVGFGDIRYVNDTGRNDLVTMKVARDDRYVYFYAETAETLTPPTDPNWMLLFINIDQDHTSGWEGYNFVVNLEVDDETTSMHRLTDGWNPEKVADLPYAVNDNRLELAIPREALGLADPTPEPRFGCAAPVHDDADLTPPVAFDFKWADNIQAHGDITEFFRHGDVAPDRRFNYRYME